MLYVILCIAAAIACYVAFVEGDRTGFKRGVEFQKHQQAERDALIGKDDETDNQD